MPKKATKLHWKMTHEGWVGGAGQTENNVSRQQTTWHDDLPHIIHHSPSCVWEKTFSALFVPQPAISIIPYSTVSLILKMIDKLVSIQTPTHIKIQLGEFCLGYKTAFIFFLPGPIFYVFACNFNSRLLVKKGISTIFFCNLTTF